jgi:hypothetical protein
MATILGLALKINADASGVPRSLTPVEKALRSLDVEAAKVTKVFENFAKASGAAADVQRRFESEIQSLTQALQAGEINGQQFADGFAAIRAAAGDLAETFAEGARVTEQYRTEEDRRAETLERLATLLEAGAISEATYSRARAEASGANAAAAREEQTRLAQINSLQSEAAAITARYQTDQEKRAASEARLNTLREAGVLSEETYKRAIEDASGATQAAVKAEQERSAALAEGKRLTDQFLSADQQRAAELQRLNSLYRNGTIEAETFARAVASSSQQGDSTQLQRFAEAIGPLREQAQSGAMSLEEFQRAAAGIADAVAASTAPTVRSAEAILELKSRLDAGTISIEEYRAQFAQIQSGDFRSTFTVEVLGVREGVEATERLQSAVSSLQGTQIEAALQITGTESIDQLRSQFASIDGAKIDAILQVLGVETVDEAKARLATIDGTTVTAQLNTVGIESIAQAQQAIDSLEGKQVEAVLEITGAESIEQLRSEFASIDETRIDAVLEILGVDAVDDAKARLASLQGTQIEAVLRVLGVDTVDEARSRLASLDGTTVTAELNAVGMESIEQAQRVIDSLEGKDITVLAETLGASSVEELTQIINAVESKTVSVETSTNADETARAVRSLVEEQDAYQSLLRDAERLNEANRSSAEKQARQLERLDAVYATGKLRIEAYNAEAARILGINELAAASERERAAASAAAAADQAAASRIIEANLTKQERAQRDFEKSTQELNRLRAAGRLTESDYATALQRTADAYAKATIAASKFDAASDKASGASVLKFNELSGILSALPGPIGNVAGRLSGLSSAGEGLARVFSGGLAGGLSSVGKSVAALVNPFTLAVGGVVAFGAAALAVTRGLAALEDRVENLGNIADKLGVSFEFIQTLEEAANRSGTSIDAVSAAFGRLQKSVLGVDEESKAAQKALSEIGVTAEELAQLSPEDQYQRIGAALADIEDPARRTATATALFGKAGADLIPFFNNLPGATADIERFGRSLTAIDRRRVDEFGAGLDALSVATQGLGQTLLLPFVGLGEGVATAFAEITAGITAIIDPIGQILEPVLTQIGRIIQLLGTNLGNLGRVIGAVFQPFATVAQTVSQALEPLYDGLFGFLEVFGDASVQVTEFLVSFTSIGAIAANASALGDTLSRVVAIVTTAFSRIGELIGNTLGQAVEWVSRSVTAFVEFTGLVPTLEAIGGTISSVFGAVSSVFQTIASAIGGTVGRLLTMAENFLGIERSAEAASSGVDQVTNSTVQLTEEQKRAAAEVQKAVENSSGVLDTAIQKAGEFGQAGFEAAFQFQEALADLKEQADANELNAEQYSRGVALATAEFDKQVDRLKQIQDETRKAAEEAQKRVDADRQVADALLEQARINEQFGGDASRAKAADAVLAVEREIARIKESVGAARDSGDAEAVATGEERIRQLQEIQNQQAAIADGSAKAAADEAKRVEDQKKRVDALIASSDTRSELEQQLIDVQEQQKITLDQLIVARQTFNREQADAAAGRLAQLDQLQAKLDDQQQAVEQGFGEGFAKAFDATNKGIDELIVKAEQQFGTVGALAGEALRAGVAAAQARADADKTFSAEAYEREVAQQRDIFQQRLDAANRVEEFLRNGIDARQQAELKATEELEKRKKEAATNVQAIEAKLIEERKKLEEAREAGDLRGARAGATRVRELERVQRQEQQLADGRLRQQDQIGQQFVSGLNTAQQFQTLVAQQNDNFLKSFNDTYAGANQALAAAAERAAKMERLLTPTNQLANTADIRTQEGQDILLGLAASAQDPRLIEAKLQTKQLQLIAQGIGQAASNYFNSPVAIVGGAVLG